MTISGKLTRPQKRKGGSENTARGRTYQWKCIKDPSRDKDFLGNLFRTIDITGYGGGFPSGTVFENTRTGKWIAQ